MTSDDLKRDLKPIFEAFHKRSDYIKCRIDDIGAESTDIVGAVNKACMYSIYRNLSSTPFLV